MSQAFSSNACHNHLMAMKHASAGHSSIRLSMQEVIGILLILFKQGVAYPSRWTFWKLLFKIMKTRPRRLGLFFRYCGLGIHYDAFRRNVVTTLSDLRARITAP